MVFAKMENVVAIRAMWAVCVINYHAMHVVQNMANVKMVHVFAHRVGMADTAHYVSTINLFICFFLLDMFVCAHLRLSLKMFKSVQTPLFNYGNGLIYLSSILCPFKSISRVH